MALGSALRMTRCGYPNCRCHAAPPQLHGPYHQWTRKINGKTVTRILSDDQLADHQPWFDNQRRLRDLITELETLSQESPTKTPAGSDNQDHVAAARLTCGGSSGQPEKAQLIAKREHLTGQKHNSNNRVPSTAGKYSSSARLSARTDVRIATFPGSGSCGHGRRIPRANHLPAADHGVSLRPRSLTSALMAADGLQLGGSTPRAGPFGGRSGRAPGMAPQRQGR